VTPIRSRVPEGVVNPAVIAAFDGQHGSLLGRHQALWNYPPGYVHRLENKTFLLREYRERVRIVKEQRLMANRLTKEKIFCQVSD